MFRPVPRGPAPVDFALEKTLTIYDPLSPEMRDVLDRLARASAGVNRYDLAFPEARQVLEDQRVWWNSEGPRLPRVETFMLRAGEMELRARIYDPRGRDAAATDDGPVVVYMHGGGWCVGSIDTHDRITRTMAHISGLRVLSLDYPLAPEAPFPMALDALVAVIQDPPADPRIGGPSTGWILSGDSAGANLSVAGSLRLREMGRPMPLALLLFYGCYQDDLESKSYRTYGGGTFGLSVAAMRKYWKAYAANGGRREELYPLKADLHGLPPSLVVAAECDVLYDENITMYEKLAAAGVEADLLEVPQVIHGFLAFGRTLEAANETLRDTCRWLESHLPGRG